MPRSSEPTLESADAFLAAVRQRGSALRDQFFDDPLGLALELGLMMPRKPHQVMQELGLYSLEAHGPITPGLRDLIVDTCLLDVKSAAVVGPRGGGKSQGVSFIEFFLVFVRKFDALNLGGSELQADQVYQYLVAYIESDVYWQSLVKGEALASKTTTTDDAWIRVLTASQKSVRSPHAGGRKKGGRMAGGVLVIDEEAEASKEIVAAALPTINTARPSVNVRSSTFHNAEGSFAELIADHVEMGYKLYRWNVFDVAERCTFDCATCEPCFSQDHYEDMVNEETLEVERQLVHKAYCGGIAHYAEGWVPITEIKTLWARMKRNHSQFEVEQMGSRPSSAGHVLKDMPKFENSIVHTSAAQLYIPGCFVTICVDWGSSNAAVSVWQEQPGDKHVLLHADLLIEHGQSQIFGIILGYAAKYQGELLEVAADIGGGGSYMNPKLRDEHRLPVRDVDFAQEKEMAAAAWNIYNEGNDTVIPAEFEDFISQVKNWRRKKGRINKGNDHLCDTAVCYFAKFVDRLNIRRIPVGPRSFGTASPLGQPAAGRFRQRDTAVQVSRPVAGGIKAIGSRRRT